MDFRNYEYQSDFARKHFAQGYREMLRNLLQQRFGALPPDIESRLEQADAGTLDAWASRVLTAASLADVFDSDPR
jgi:hypothetical protein